MTTPTITDYLKYANLQMAAEAFLYDEATKSIMTGQQLIDALKVGNSNQRGQRHLPSKPMNQ